MAFPDIYNTALTNNTPNWINNMQLLQASSTGVELKDCLIKCIKMCEGSHSTKMGTYGDAYRELVDYVPPAGGPALPPGWFLDPNDNIYKKEDING